MGKYKDEKFEIEQSLTSRWIGTDKHDFDRDMVKSCG